ncbi:MAG: hypothetical protein ACOCQD_04115, partial [archaeon]
KNDWRIIEASNDIVKTSDFLKFVENDYELNITLYRKDKVSMRDEVLIDLNRKINLYTDVFWTPKDIQTVFKVGSSKAYEIIRTVNHKYKRVNQKPLRVKVSNILDYYDIDLDFQVKYIKKILEVMDFEGGTYGDK